MEVQNHPGDPAMHLAFPADQLPRARSLAKRALHATDRLLAAVLRRKRDRP